MAIVADPADLDRRNWRRAKPPLGDSTDVANLYESEQRLSQIEQELEEIDHEQKVAEEIASQAACRWEAHLAECTLQLRADGERSSEDLRRAVAISTTSSDGVPGRQLYNEMVATESIVRTLDRSIRVADKRISSLQTGIRGLRQAVGIDP